MGTILNTAILAQAQTILLDASGVRWPNTELLGWLNEGQRAIVGFKPTAYMKSLAVQLAAGTKQAAPSDCVQLVDIARNMGTDGNTPGRAIRITNRATLDAQVPNWHAATPSATVKHYTYTLLDPLRFYVYPPQPANGQGYVEITYGALPPAGVLGVAIAVEDVYAHTLLDYVLYRAFSKDTEFGADANRATAHQNAFLASLTGKAEVEAGLSPNVTAPANPKITPT